MAVLSDYTSGTISLANGSVTVTGTGTLFEVTRFREGDTLQIQNLTAVIASVDSDTQLTLAEPWTGASIVDGPYRARQLADGTRVGTQAATLIELLGDGTLAGIAALGIEEGKALVGGPAGQYELVDTSTFGIQDANGSLGKLAALTLAANKILNTDGSGDLTQSDITAAALVLLKLAGTAAANKLPYFDDANSAALADYTAAARALTNLSGTAAADMLPYLTGVSGAALTALTSFARTILDDTTGAAMWATMGGVRGVASNNIYWKTPGGQLTIAGTTAGTTDANAALTAVFPVAFANANYQIVAIGGEITIPTYNVLWDRAPGACSFQVYNTGGNPRISGAARINYIAIGDA